MNELQLITHPNKKLYSPCEIVSIFDEHRLQKLKEEMIKAMNLMHGIGLAANQIGLNERIFVANISFLEEDRNFVGPNMFINPEIVGHGYASKTTREGCLSVPGFWPKIERWKSIDVEFQNEKGEIFFKTFTDLNARIFQHEYGHVCLGKTILDLPNRG